MRELFREQIKTFKICGRSFWKQEVSFKLATIALGYPLFLLLINISLKLSDMPYLTNESIRGYFKRPATAVIMLLLLVIICIYTLYEISMISVFCDYDVEKENVNGYSLLRLISKRFLSLFTKKRFLIVSYGAICLPMISVTGLSMYVYMFETAETIIKLTRNEKDVIAIIVGLVMLVALLMIFTANIMLDEKVSFKEAVVRSVKLFKKNFIQTIIYIIIANLIFAVFMALIYIIYSLLVIGGVKLLGKSELGIAIYLSMLRGLSGGIIVFMLLIYIPLTYLCVTAMYRKFTSGTNISKEKVLEKIPHAQPKHKKIYKVSFWSITILTAVINIYYFYSAISNNPFYNLEFASIPEITAHRGSSAAAPENTMSAFEHAIDDMADYIELDVKQTKDGVVIALHDANLKRTTGVNKDIWKVDYEFVRGLDAGSWFAEEFAGEYVPTLEEVLIHCKGKVKLNIEIKPTGHDKNLEQAVVELVEKYDMEKMCVVTSMKYDVLKRVKAVNSKIKTGYIMSVAYGKFYNMEYADFFSVNYSFVTKKIVDLIHNNGKEIHVWTVNGAENIEEMAKMGVDNIITDNPVKCREIVYSRYSSEKIMDILRYVME